MNDTRWQRAKEIFDQALGIAPDLRGSFVETACSGDEQLQAEVEKLLTSYKSDFLEETALGAADLLIEPRLTAGQVIGRYRIGDLIGTGGMGEVFLADDTELNRPVAFKVLRREVADDKERVRRFIQEARAASALNHPNILTIYEIGSFEGSRYIVSEYVDGETLRERMAAGLTAAESLEITCQIAAALQAAHSAGIVHRDIKPENIMLRKDGLVKVLDFGLAKLTEADDFPIDGNASPLSRLQTSPGLIMGTVAYMSPEQASGKVVDSRTDLWSLGVVFHEMLTGESPFKGESVTDLVTSILKHDPASLDLTEISQELQPICKKALAKDQKARYQTAQDLLTDLQGEKKRMEYAIQTTPYVTVSGSDELKTQMIRPRPTLSAEYIVTSVKRHKFAMLGAAIVVLIAAVGLSVYRYNGATPPQSQPSFAAIDASTTEKDLKFSRMPISGQTKEVVISPDGKYVAYLDLPAKGVKLLNQETSAQTELVPSPARGYLMSLGFSPDSKYVYYAAIPGGDGYGIFRVPVAGGAPVSVVEHSYSPVSFSPDGSTMVFTTEVNNGIDGQIIVLASPDGSNQKTIATFDSDNWISNVPLWSPDGKMIVCQVASPASKDRFVKLVGINVADGRQQPISETRWTEIYGAVWLPNGNLIISAKERLPDRKSESTIPIKLWSILPGPEPKAITSGEVNYQGLSSTRNGDVLVTSRVAQLNNLVLIDTTTGKAAQVTTSGEVAGGFTWAPDGRIIMGSKSTGNVNLWIMNTDGSTRRQLTREPNLDTQPVVSPDGRSIVFQSDRINKVMHLFRMNIDGTDVKQLTNGGGEVFAQFSGDGKSVYYIETRDKSREIRKVSIEGGEPVSIATPPAGWQLDQALAINRSDGRIAFGLIRGPFMEREFKVAIIRENSRTPAKLLDVPKGLRTSGPSSIALRWSPDGRALTMLGGYKDNGGGIDVWALPVDGKSKAKALTNLMTPTTQNFNWSFDGRQLLVSRTTINMEPILIRNAGK